MVFNPRLRDYFGLRDFARFCCVRGSMDMYLPIEWRSINFDYRLYPRFVVRDEEAIFFITPKEDTSVSNREDTGLWTNSKALVHVLKALFEELWRDGINVDRRIREIETGKPPEETVIIKEAQEAYRKFREIVDAAKEEIITVTSPKGIVRIFETAPVRQCFERGVKIRIMAPIDLDNFETAQKLSKYSQIRHIDVAHMRIAIVDNKHLFQFKTPPLDKETAEPMASFDNVLYTNDPEYVQRTREMLNDIWNRSLEISEIRSEAAMRVPVNVSTSASVSKVVEDMLRNNVGSVLVVEDRQLIGIITEKDILDRVIKTGRKPENTYANEIMSKPVVTIDADRPLIEALRTMRNSGIRRLAVVKEGKLVGILTERRALEKIEYKNSKNI